MLTKFRVSNFKKFNDTLELDLSSPEDYAWSSEAIQDGCVAKGLIYGKNDSGKSCLCLALFDIIRNLTDNTTTPSSEYDPLLNLHSKREEAVFEYYFRFEGKKVVYSYARNASGNLTEENLSIDGNDVIHYDFMNNHGFSALKGSTDLKLDSNDFTVSRVKYVRANSILDGGDGYNRAFIAFMDFVDRMLMFRSSFTGGYQGLRSDERDITEAIVSMHKTKDFEKFLRDYRIDCSLTEKETGNGGRGLFWHFKETGSDVEFWKLASTGTRDLTFLYYWLYVQDKKPSLILIDEFDAFYHYRLAENLVKRMKGITDTQIFLTTHNTDLLNNDFLRPDCYFLLKDGKIKPLDRLTRKQIRFENNLQKMFKAEFFGE